MKALALRLGTKLVEWAGGDSLAATRAALGSVSPTRPTDLTGDERTRELADLVRVRDTQAFQRMMSMLMNAQVDFIVKRSTLDNLYAARGTLNGLALVQEMLGRAQTELDNLKRDNPFNKFETL